VRAVFKLPVFFQVPDWAKNRRAEVANSPMVANAIDMSPKQLVDRFGFR
jgi:hypothetical protein